MYKKFLKFVKSKTMIFATLLAAFGAIELKISLIANHIPPDVYGYLVIGISTVVAVLRALTTTSINDK